MQHYLFELVSPYSPVVQALFATLFTWFMTAAGAAPVLFTTRVNKRLMDAMLGLAAGVMIASRC